MATPSPTASPKAEVKLPPQFKLCVGPCRRAAAVWLTGLVRCSVGIILAVVSGLLIGSSFVFKKKGLLKSGNATEGGVAYLKSVLWWTGMIMMILGELCNFAAYAFVEALVVTPLGALSVVICAILSSIFLKETLTFFGWLGCALCILGSVIIALNTPPEATVGQIKEFQKLFLAPGFLGWTGFLVAASLTVMFYFGPRYGKNSMLWYIAVCSMIGGLSVSVTTGLGAAIVTSVLGDNQFKHWFIYFLIGFVAVTLITEVYYLNLALALFNTAMVTPTYYVTFTFCTLVTTIILFQGLKATAPQIITLVMGFLVICVGITVLQMSKIDPTKLNKLDRRSTMLLEAARAKTEHAEKDPLVDIEEPGVDALRGGFGTVGSIIRARTARRASMASRASRGASFAARQDALAGMTRHQLYDPPVGGRDGDAISLQTKASASALGSPRPQTIKFRDEDVLHRYPAGPGRGGATHETGKPLSRENSTGAPAAMVTGPKLPPGPAQRFLYDDPFADGEGDEADVDDSNMMTPGRRAGSKRRPFAGKTYPVNEGDTDERVGLVSDAPVEGGVRLVSSQSRDNMI
ncbi:DUF803-domain-containing protein [Auricularia subglabra TFB-10046 SS5]|uniref:DUF803-domain-containing protein n=1 Tax=Auricularia subglabra (strain TFB-10046 / SS5) TaxID=717982 RepID=J0LF11_AURST|nr:DUF803-domain-containing protein [Auricularia subglabra TFB-10046 SS5]